MTLDGVYVEPKKMSTSSMDFPLSAYEEIDCAGDSFLKRTASIKLYASQPPPPSPPKRPLRKFIGTGLLIKNMFSNIIERLKSLKKLCIITMDKTQKALKLTTPLRYTKTTN